MSDNNIISDWLLNHGFSKYYGNDNNYDCIMRIHVLHYLFWSEKLKHFSLAVLNEENKKGAAGTYKKWNTIMIPKVVYTINDAENLLKSITN